MGTRRHSASPATHVETKQYVYGDADIHVHVDAHAFAFGNREIEDNYIRDECYIKFPHHPDQALQQDNPQP